MKKRFLSLILVFALMCTMSICASAATVTKRGPSSGGDDGNLIVTATLSANSNKAYASSRVGATNNVQLFTTMNYYYWNIAGHEQAVSTSGTTYVELICPIAGMGRRATSTHELRGGEYWGNWTGYLSTEAYS